MALNPATGVRQCATCGGPSEKHAYCTECRKAYDQKYYQKNKKRRIEQVADWAAANRLRLKLYKEQHACADCGNVFPAVCMDFHHLGDKEDNISALVGVWSWDRLQTEIDKCDLLCACCHRIRHEQERVQV